MHRYLADQPHVADWLGATGQWAGAAATVAAVVVALRIARSDAVKRSADEQSEAFAQASLVLVEEPTFIRGRAGHVFRVGVQNLGDRPILDLTLQVWPGLPDEKFSNINRMYEQKRHVLIHLNKAATVESETASLAVDVGRYAYVHGWRLVWTDHTGVQWVHGYRHTVPQRLTEVDDRMPANPVHARPS